MPQQRKPKTDPAVVTALAALTAIVRAQQIRIEVLEVGLKAAGQSLTAIAEQLKIAMKFLSSIDANARTLASTAGNVTVIS